MPIKRDEVNYTLILYQFGFYTRVPISSYTGLQSARKLLQLIRNNLEKCIGTDYLTTIYKQAISWFQISCVLHYGQRFYNHECGFNDDGGDGSPRNVHGDHGRNRDTRKWAIHGHGSHSPPSRHGNVSYVSLRPAWM